MKEKLAILVSAFLIAGCSGYQQEEGAEAEQARSPETAQQSENEQSPEPLYGTKQQDQPQQDQGQQAAVDQEQQQEEGQVGEQQDQERQHTTQQKEPQSAQDQDKQQDALFGQKQDEQDKQKEGEQQAKEQGERTLPSGLDKATALLGSQVENEQGEKLGQLEDLAIDPDTGAIQYAVLSFGGILDIGSKYVAVPIEAFSKAEGEEDVLNLSVSKQRLQDAEGFNKKNWPESPTGAWGAEAQPAEKGQAEQREGSGSGQSQEAEENQEEQRRSEEQGAIQPEARQGDREQQDGQAAAQQREQRQGERGTAAEQAARGAAQQQAQAEGRTAEMTADEAGDPVLVERVRALLLKGAEGEKPVLQAEEMKDMEVLIWNKTVVLKGTVDSKAKKQNIENQIEQLQGIESVENQLQVQGQSQGTKQEGDQGQE